MLNSYYYIAYSFDFYNIWLMKYWYVYSVYTHILHIYIYIQELFFPMPLKAYFHWRNFSCAILSATDRKISILFLLSFNFSNLYCYLLVLTQSSQTKPSFHFCRASGEFSYTSEAIPTTCGCFVQCASHSLFNQIFY